MSPVSWIYNLNPNTLLIDEFITRMNMIIFQLYQAYYLHIHNTFLVHSYVSS